MSQKKDSKGTSRRDFLKSGFVAGASAVVGGSLLIEDEFEKMIIYLKQKSDIPVLIFPGDTYQISSKADGILLLSLISGRNSELLIGKHVLAAPRIKRSQIEVLPTGYMLVDSGKQTTASI